MVARAWLRDVLIRRQQLAGWDYQWNGRTTKYVYGIRVTDVCDCNPSVNVHRTFATQSLTDSSSWTPSWLTYLLQNADLESFRVRKEEP